MFFREGTSNKVLKAQHEHISEVQPHAKQQIGLCEVWFIRPKGPETMVFWNSLNQLKWWHWLCETESMDCLGLQECLISLHVNEPSKRQTKQNTSRVFICCVCLFGGLLTLWLSRHVFKHQPPMTASTRIADARLLFITQRLTAKVQLKKNLSRTNCLTSAKHTDLDYDRLTI